MGATKSAGYSSEAVQLARYAKALAHPARMAILELLIRKQACICGALVDELPLSQSTVSQHLKELKIAGLIKGEIEGAAICYCIDEVEWQKARTLFAKFFENAIVNPISCC